MDDLNRIGIETDLKIFTSAKEVMFLPVFVCGFVSLFVCEHDNSKTYGRILMKFSRHV